MSGFSSGWLDLREPADLAARDDRLLVSAAEIIRNSEQGLIVDLGCGTGSTARAMAPHLPPGARWRLVDHDAALLALASERVGPSATTVVADLADLSSLPLGGSGLVTASALFDLVSADWIEGFADRLAAEGAALYAALTYDGRTLWTPGDARDADVLSAFNRHQQSDKGLGRSLGPLAAAHLAAALERRGYGVETAPSDWRLGPSQSRLAEAHARGVAEAAVAAGMDAAAAAAWLEQRLAAAETGTTLVGHVDLVARPPR